MVNSIPDWTETLLRSKLEPDEKVTAVEVLQDSPVNKMAVAYTPSRAFVTTKTLFRKDAFEIKAPGQQYAQEGRRISCGSCGESFRVWNHTDAENIHCFICGAEVPVGGEVEQAPSRDTGAATEEALGELAKKPEKPEPPTPEEASAAEPVPDAVATEDNGEDEPYIHDGYTLYTRDVELRGGRVQTIYFFAKNEPKSGEPVGLPDGYVVRTNPRTGLPYLKKGEAEGEGADGDGSTHVSAGVSLEAVDGVGPKYRDVLNKAGFSNVEDLLNADAATVAEKTGVPEPTVARWQALGGLTDVKGVGRATALKLAGAGVTNVRHLAEADVEAVAEATGISAKRLESFVVEAKGLVATV